MSKLNKKFVSAALTLTTSVWMSGAMLLVPVAHAQSTADLQAQIAALLAQIQHPDEDQYSRVIEEIKDLVWDTLEFVRLNALRLV